MTSNQPHQIIPYSRFPDLQQASECHSDQRSFNHAEGYGPGTQQYEMALAPFKINLQPTILQDPGDKVQVRTLRWRFRV